MVLLSTVFFAVFGLDDWRLLACIWAIVPLCNTVLFAIVPINDLVEEGEGETRRQLLSHPLFWAMMGLMVCAGASEIIMAQWASTFAEMGLGVSKSMGDLLGPCLFALLMGAARVLSAVLSRRIPLDRLMGGSCLLCIFSYLLAILAPQPILALLGCGLCGLSVGVMWPGTFSIASEHIPKGGFPMFAILAFCGDVGCMVGPTAAGQIAAACEGDLKAAFAFALIFPLAALGILIGVRKRKRGIKR